MNSLFSKFGFNHVNEIEPKSRMHQRAIHTNSNTLTKPLERHGLVRTSTLYTRAQRSDTGHHIAARLQLKLYTWPAGQRVYYTAEAELDRHELTLIRPSNRTDVQAGRVCARPCSLLPPWADPTATAVTRDTWS